MKIPNYPPRLWTVHGRVMVSPSARVRLVGVEMMVAMGEVAGVDEAKVRRARGRPIGPIPIRPISNLGLQTSIDQLMHSTYYLSLVVNGDAALAVSLDVNKCVRRQHGRHLERFFLREKFIRNLVLGWCLSKIKLCCFFFQFYVRAFCETQVKRRDLLNGLVGLVGQ